MPTYQFSCTKCNHTFDQYLKIEERDNPTKSACPNCKKKKSVVRDYNNFTQSIGSDTNVTPNKVTGGRWNELMGRMKKGLAKRHHKNLDDATSRTGRYWSG
jgi:putative FmdB family regulatory protein